MSSVSSSVLRALADSEIERVVQRSPLGGYASAWYRKAVRTVVGDVVTVTIDGVSVDFAPPDSLLLSKRFQEPMEFDEAPLLIDMLDELEPDDTVLDVGAHIGYHACFAAEATPRGEVVAVEAHPLNAHEVVRNSRLNGHDIDVLSFALSNETGVADLSISGPAVGGSTHSLQDRSTDSISVSTHRADDVLDITPSVIKIDVEGAEQLVLEGMPSILSDEACRVVYCELHHADSDNTSIEDFGGSESEVYALLEDHGFEIEEITRRRSNYHTSNIKAVKQ